MKIYNILPYIFSVFILLNACQPSGEVDKQKVAESLTSESARKNWENVSNRETVSAINDIKEATDTYVTQRHKEVSSTEDQRQQVPTPIFNKNQIAGVEVRTSTDLSSYQGIFEVRNVDNEQIEGVLDDESTFTIYYKLPKNTLSNRIQVKSQLSLFYETEITGGSHTQTLILQEKRNPLLISIEDGSNEPLQKEYSGLNIFVRQLESENRDSNMVRITLYDQIFTMTPGQSTVREAPVGSVEFFLQTSYSKPRSIMEEGLNYYVRLYGYAL